MSDEWLQCVMGYFLGVDFAMRRVYHRPQHGICAGGKAPKMIGKQGPETTDQTVKRMDLESTAGKYGRYLDETFPAVEPKEYSKDRMFDSQARAVAHAKWVFGTRVPALAKAGNFEHGRQVVDGTVGLLWGMHVAPLSTLMLVDVD